jgi:hypothetical protein
MRRVAMMRQCPTIQDPNHVQESQRLHLQRCETEMQWNRELIYMTGKPREFLSTKI